jgi:hypothetical protein
MLRGPPPAVAALALCLSSTAALVINFTGNVPLDFPVGPGVFVAVDSVGDVGWFTTGGAFGATGFDIHDARFAYDPASDTAYFGGCWLHPKGGGRGAPWARMCVWSGGWGEVVPCGPSRLHFRHWQVTRVYRRRNTRSEGHVPRSPFALRPPTTRVEGETARVLKGWMGLGPPRAGKGGGRGWLLLGVMGHVLFCFREPPRRQLGPVHHRGL